MNNSQIGSVALTLAVFIATVHCFGYFSERFKQPRLVGEILAGVLLGPFCLGQWAPGFYAAILGQGAGTASINEVVLNFIYWVGLFMLMFISGAGARRLMAAENQKQTLWLLGIGTPLPFFLVLGLGLAALLPLKAITGTAGQETSALLVLAIAVSVTSIPVISRIFQDLGIIHTRFASIILGSAVLEDIILWAVLAVATSLVKTTGNEQVLNEVAGHLGGTSLFMFVGLVVAPPLLRKLHRARWNIVYRASPRGYVTALIFGYIALASYLDVNLVFGAFLAGFGIVGGVHGPDRTLFEQPIEAISDISNSLFIPVYFAFVGLKLQLGRDFSLSLFLIFLLGSTVVALLCNGLAAWMAGFRKLDLLNLAITQNARGGPGIVLASVAYEAHIINGAFYTSLVLTAVLTSQAAGLWLRWVLSQGWPLLSSNPEETWQRDIP